MGWMSTFARCIHGRLSKISWCNFSANRRTHNYCGVIYNVRDFSQSGLPACDSSTSQNEVKLTVANSPGGKVLGLQIIIFSDARKTKETNDVVECEATVTMDNAQKHRLIYSFTKQPDGKYLIKTLLQ
jgi:hypothetical protein